MPSGIVLNDLSKRSRVRTHLHHSSEEWCITSDHTVEEVFDEKLPLLNLRLPGQLGAYLYPSDAVFHIKTLDHTSLEDFEAIRRKEHLVDEVVHEVFVPRSLPAPDDEDDDGAEDVECDESGEDDDDETLEEEEGQEELDDPTEADVVECDAATAIMDELIPPD